MGTHQNITASGIKIDMYGVVVSTFCGLIESDDKLLLWYLTIGTKISANNNIADGEKWKMSKKSL